jgi:AcrR family transcriptional regulator
MSATAQIDILETMLSLEAAKGHMQWKISDLARAAKVSRSLIYYYFGRSKREIVETGVDIVAAEYFGLTQETVDLLRQRRGWETVLRTRERILSRPAFAVFYLRWRTFDSPLRTRLVKIEERYQRMLREAFPHLSMSRVVGLHGILYGIVTAPFLTTEAIDEVRELLLHL